MRGRKRFYNVGADQPLAQTTVDHRSDNQNGAGGEPHDQLRDAGAVGRPAPTISEMEVVAAAWPIYDRLLQHEDCGKPGRLSDVWVDARQIAHAALKAAREVA